MGNNLPNGFLANVYDDILLSEIKMKASDRFDRVSEIAELLPDPSVPLYTSHFSSSMQSHLPIDDQEIRKISCRRIRSQQSTGPKQAEHEST
jgi:hypothetical protein